MGFLSSIGLDLISKSTPKAYPKDSTGYHSTGIIYGTGGPVKKDPRMTSSNPFKSEAPTYVRPMSQQSATYEMERMLRALLSELQVEATEAFGESVFIDFYTDDRGPTYSTTRDYRVYSVRVTIKGRTETLVDYTGDNRDRFNAIVNIIKQMMCFGVITMIESKFGLTAYGA